MRLLSRCALAGAVFASVWTPGCGHEEGTRVGNRKPVVVIKGGPLDQSTASYTTRIYWSGWDEDGIVTHYEYALDPPDVFTQEEIADPEHAPGLSFTRLFGPGLEQDTLIYSKVVDGDVHSYRWVQTREFSRAFAFETPEPDSGFLNGQRVPIERFSGYHLIYVRCRDNDGDYSDNIPATPQLDVDYIGYTATTQTPHSEIIRPRVDQEILDLGPTLSARWRGLDPDSPDAEKVPAGFIYKLLRLDTLEPPVDLVHAQPGLLLTRGDPWIYQRGDSTDKILQLSPGGRYLFGVRAVDLAGAVEPLLNLGRNAFKFQSLPTAGRPQLTVRESSAGSFGFRGAGQVKETEVPAGRNLYFNWTATAEGYGGEIEAYSWGLDIPDLTVEGPASGWSAWGNITSTGTPIKFSAGGTHVLAVRVRDVAGAVTLGQLLLQVIDFPFDREILLVDDSMDGIFPRDSEHDAFWRDMVTYYSSHSNVPPEQFFTFEAHGPGDRGNATPALPELSVLGRYRLIVWECYGVGYNAETALNGVSARTPRLASYLGAGGKLWLGGRMTVGAMSIDPSGTRGDLVYPKEQLREGQFAYDFMKLRSSLIHNDKGAGDAHYFNRANPYPPGPVYDREGMWVPDLPYDSLRVDFNKLSLGQRAKGGFSHADAVFNPIYAETEPDFLGNLDSLYVYGASGPEYLGRSSTYHQRLCGFRWSDPDPDRRHGRIQWFGFSMYFMEADHAQRVFQQSIDWLREEAVPQDP